ncbi:Protein ABTS-2, partial [Aphelenchoides avenae]
KDTKSALETARTYATLFSEAELRNKLTHVRSRDEFRSAIKKCAKRLAEAKPVEQPEHGVQLTSDVPYYIGRGVVEDFKRRIVHYASDYTDGIADASAIQKTISTAVFLYFCILPTAIALGMLNDENTHGKINVKKVILGQWIGGLIFGVFGGQLFLVMLTTAPLSIYVQVIQAISTSSGYDFYKMYTCVGIWCAIFVTVMAVTEAAVVMKSLEELFGLFIAIELIYAAIDAMLGSIIRYRPGCASLNSTELAALTERLDCDRSSGLLFVVLMTGTAWISLSLYSFRSTPFLTKAKRELLSAYALPVGVLLMSFVGDFFFADVPKEVFTYDESVNPLTVSAFWDQSVAAHLICAGLGFPLATLFFMDQLIVTNTVDNNENNLKKGSAANWDLLIVAAMNVLLSIFALPWMHGSLPQAFLHLRAQADVEDRTGTVQQVIVKNRESRLAILIAHFLMIPTYFYLLPYLQLIPTSVFHGLFLYMAFSSMIGNELCERLLLIFTEQRSYPPTHYIRRVSQRVVHCFTIVEVLQLVVLLAVGFAPSPVVKMTFPVVIFLSIPLRSF